MQKKLNFYYFLFVLSGLNCESTPRPPSELRSQLYGNELPGVNISLSRRPGSIKSSHNGETFSNVQVDIGKQFPELPIFILQVSAANGHEQGNKNH